MSRLDSRDHRQLTEQRLRAFRERNKFNFLTSSPETYRPAVKAVRRKTGKRA